MENLEKKVGHCYYNGILHYQRFMDNEEKAKHEGQNAFCLVEDISCQYNEINKCYNYCTANNKENKDERRRTQLYK